MDVYFVYVLCDDGLHYRCVPAETNIPTEWSNAYALSVANHHNKKYTPIIYARAPHFRTVAETKCNTGCPHLVYHILANRASGSNSLQIGLESNVLAQHSKTSHRGDREKSQKHKILQIIRAVAWPSVSERMEEMKPKMSPPTAALVHMNLTTCDGPSLFHMPCLTFVMYSAWYIGNLTASCCQEKRSYRC